jgi:hypothetical protein
MKLVKKKKYKILSLAITQLERHKEFEIKLPLNVTKVTGTIITTSAD